MIIFEWLNNQLLKMQWLYDLVAYLVENVFGLSLDSLVGASIHFFVYDVIKIFILLIFIIYFISFVQSYFPPERTKDILQNVRGIIGNLLGSLLGVLTPFCSCSSIPIFIGFTNSGLPLGVTFSFLITSPLVDLASVLLISSFFGFRIAGIYVVTGMILAIIGGTLIGKFKMERYVETFVFKSPLIQSQEQKLTSKERHDYSKTQALDVFRKVWLYVVVGVGIGAAIHNWIPQEWVLMVLGQDKWYSVLVATIIGIPMYASLFGTLPIAIALFGQGVGLGTIIAFMMSITALSIPSIIMLKKVVKTKLLIFFVAYVSIGILTIGYMFNAWL